MPDMDEEMLRKEYVKSVAAVHNDAARGNN